MNNQLSEHGLLYECYICHKLKPRSKMITRGSFDYCIDCDDYNKVDEQPEIIIIPKIIMPTPNEFNLFYDDWLFYGFPVNGVVDNGILTLSTEKNKNIQVSVDGIVQMLSDKINNPINSTNIKISKEDEINIRNAYLETCKKLEDIIIKFNKIILFNDSRIKEFADKHYIIKSQPLTLRVEYLEWERTLVDSYIKAEVQKGLHEKDKEMSRIRQDYVDKLNTERINGVNKVEKYSNEILSLNNTLERVNNIMQSLKEQYNQVKNEKDEMYSKMKILEEDNAKADIELVKAKARVGELEGQLKRFEKEMWSPTLTSTVESPSYRNKSGEIVTFPCSLIEFRSRYKAKLLSDEEKVEGEILYEEIVDGKSSGVVFSVPEQLESKLIEELSKIVAVPENKEDKEKKVSKKEEKKDKEEKKEEPIINDGLTPKQRQVLKIIPFGIENGITQTELKEISGSFGSDISVYVKKYRTLGLIEENFHNPDGSLNTQAKIYRVGENK